MAAKEANKNSKTTKRKNKKKKLIIYSWRQQYCHIDSSLLPSVALVIAIPSAKNINLRSSPSSLTIAIGSVTKVLQLFIGEIFYTKNDPEMCLDSLNDTQKHSSKVVINPAVPAMHISAQPSNNSVNVFASKSESLYATVLKVKKCGPNEGSDNEDITTVSEIEGIAEYGGVHSFFGKETYQENCKAFSSSTPNSCTGDNIVSCSSNNVFGAEKTKHNSIPLQPVTTCALSDPNSFSSQDNVTEDNILTFRGCTLDQSIPTQTLKLMEESEDRSDLSKRGVKKKNKNKNSLSSSFNKSSSYNKFVQQKKVEKEFIENSSKSSMQLKLLDFKEYDTPCNQMQETMQNTSLMNDWNDSVESQYANQKIVREDKSSSKSVKKNLVFQPKLFSSHLSSHSQSSYSQSKLQVQTNYTLPEEYLHMSSKQNISKDGTNNGTKMIKNKKSTATDKRETCVKQMELNEKLQQIFDALNSLIKKELFNGGNFDEIKNVVGKLNQYLERLNNTVRNHNSEPSNGQDYIKHLQQQNKILKNENEALRIVVMRLNQEITKVKATEGSVVTEDPYINIRYISGLLVSFDQQLQEKENAINALKVSLEEMKDNMIPKEKWNLLKRQAKVVLEENEVCTKQMQLYKETICKLTNEHSQKINKLENQLNEVSKGKKHAEQELFELKNDCSLIKSQKEQIQRSQDSMIALTDHNKVVEGLKNEHQNEINKLLTKVDDLCLKLTASNKERVTLAVQNSELCAENLHFSSQMKFIEKIARKQKKQLNHYKKEIEVLKKKDLYTKKILSQVIKVAENVKKERDELVLNEKKNETLICHQENKELKKLQHLFKFSKLQARQKLHQKNKRLREQEEEFCKLRKTYENELNDLKDIVRQKQKQIERLNANKSSYDLHFNELWMSFHEDKKI